METSQMLTKKCGLCLSWCANEFHWWQMIWTFLISEVYSCEVGRVHGVDTVFFSAFFCQTLSKNGLGCKQECFRVGFGSFYLLPIYKISSKHQLVSWIGSLGLAVVTSFKISSPACENYPAYPEQWPPWLSVGLVCFVNISVLSCVFIVSECQTP